MTVPGPLGGITVIDLTRVLAGPYCTMVLADLGARVIKVEVPETGDDSRAFGPFIEGKSAYYMSINRGKESIALNLKDEADRATFEALLEEADVLVENYRGGTMERLGYGWESLHPRYPKLIYAACSGFGHTGPYAERPAYDMVVQGLGGVMSLTGHPGGPPTRVGTSIGDITAGLFTAIGVSSALHHRHASGEGMKIDIAMLDCQVAILENALARYFATGEVPGPLGARHPTIVPFQSYETADGHVIIAAGNDQLFTTLCKALACPELAGEARFKDNSARGEHVEELKVALEARLKKQPTAHWLDVLADAGVPSAPINNVEQVLNDPQIAARNMVIATDDPQAGALSMAGNPIKLSAFEDPGRREPAPGLDQHRDRILAELKD
ncbi:MAG: carnitine dehydratase [Rhodospirillaceae bacterium]|nr:carnitine dehydratase [Rhodospirillaceae bacterium]